MFTGSFLTPKGIDHLKQHKYSAGEVSPLDKFISNKMNSVVQYFPDNLAPNMITLIGTAAQFSALRLMIQDLHILIFMQLLFYFFISQWIQVMVNKQEGQINQVLQDSCSIMDQIVQQQHLQDIIYVYYIKQVMIDFIYALLFQQQQVYFTLQIGQNILQVNQLLHKMDLLIMTGLLGPQIWHSKFFGIDLLVILLGTNYSIFKDAYQAAQDKQYFYMSLFSITTYFLCVIILFMNKRIMHCLNSLFFGSLFIYNLNCIKLIISTMTKQRFKKIHTEMIVLYSFTLALSIMSFSDDIANFIGKVFFICSLTMLLEFGIRMSKLIAKHLGINVLFI